MSEVMRWKLKGFLPGVEGMCRAIMRPEVVLSSDYDAAQVELAALQDAINTAAIGIPAGVEIVKVPGIIAGQLAALREELAKQVARTNDYCSKFTGAEQRLAAAEQRNAALETALNFYADGDHLLLADPDEWDTCSGEPINWLHDAAGTASVEDGSVAKQALAKPTESGASK